MNERFYALGFSAFAGIGTKRFEQLVKAFGTAKAAWCASDKEIVAVLKNVLGQKFCEFRKTFDIDKYAKELKQKHIYFFVPSDKEYPKLLKQLNVVIPAEAGIQNKEEEPGSRIKSGMTRAPFILFAKGNIDLLSNSKTIAVVGTRKITEYGRHVTEEFVKELVARNFVIVSGMALGVDGVAHKEALKHNGSTIAVLGSGVDVPLPREHEALYYEILGHGGAIVSTFQPGEGAGIGTFPSRNKIIAGLSLGVLVTEGAADSGALITAKHAKEFGRPVFAIPGPITSSLSQGTNNLIKNGVQAVSEVQDILDNLGIITKVKILASRRSGQNPKVKSLPKGTKEEQQVLGLLQSGPLHFDEIVRTIGKDSKTVGSLLSMMELKEMIRSLGDGKYSVNV